MIWTGIIIAEGRKMLQDRDALLLFRFSEQRWIDKTIAGCLSFSCAGYFIHQAKITGNTIQGDQYEAVFAHIPKDDIRVSQMGKDLGRDLEIIPDGDFVYLRRRSAKFRPIYCLYAYTAKDALKDGKPCDVGKLEILHYFDERMYSGFADAFQAQCVVATDRRYTQLVLQPKPFLDRIRISLAKNSLNDNKKRMVDYEMRKQKIFFIEPTEQYDELLYKSPEYEYQHEARICLRNSMFTSIFDRFELDIGPLEKQDYAKLFEPVYAKFDAVIAKI